MAEIKINEFSSDYNYTIGSTSFATVALPIAASWGPGYFDPGATGRSTEEALEKAAFTHFPSTQAGMEAFLSTYRGPISGYQMLHDFSYYYALTLLSAGYDVEVCRVCNGDYAQSNLTLGSDEEHPYGTLTITAKYPGSFGNRLEVQVSPTRGNASSTGNIVIYTEDKDGLNMTPVENLSFSLLDNDTLPTIPELESKFVNLTLKVNPDGTRTVGDEQSVVLSGGTDFFVDPDWAETPADAVSFIKSAMSTRNTQYIEDLFLTGATTAQLNAIAVREWIFSAAYLVLEILCDTLTYRPNRIVSPWDDIDLRFLEEIGLNVLLPAPANVSSSIHEELLYVAAHSRCATAFLDAPRSVSREETLDYFDKLERLPMREESTMYFTNAAAFAPWGQIVYTGLNKQNIAAPSLMALLIQRGMIANQALQYEWAMPTTRKHNVAIGALDYTVPKSVLDQWQSNEGIGINAIANIPDMGVSIWGNSTLYNVPPATYNALQNLSTRFLMNAVKDIAYRCGLAITFQYNNEEAYSKFYAGCTPLLDTMKNVGAITRYEISMAADINGYDSVNANSVVGKITLFVSGVINNITIDLVALPSV